MKKLSRLGIARGVFLLVVGAAAGLAIARTVPNPRAEAATPDRETPEQRLARLKLVLPAPPAPVAVYVPAVRTGNLLFVSGHGPIGPDGKKLAGKVGKELSVEQGKAAARLVGLGVLASVRKTLGSLDKVKRVVKTLGLVNATPEFGQQPQVINGFSELMADVFGKELGVGARSAVGVGSLPDNIPVEIEIIFELAP